MYMAKKIEAVLIGLMIGIVGLSASTCSDKSETKGIIIQTEAGTLRLMPLNDRSIRSGLHVRIQKRWKN